MLALMGHPTDIQRETGSGTWQSMSFIIRVRQRRQVLQITLQDVRTRRTLHFGSWEGLFAELQRSSVEASPPLPAALASKGGGPSKAANRRRDPGNGRME